MYLYRIAPEKHLDNFQGLGASYKDGARWNKPEDPVIYFALSAATALLEMANYLPSPHLIPESYRLGVYQVPDNTQFYSLTDENLPDDWAFFPYPVSTQAIGSQWLKSNKELAMIVPSCAVPNGLEKIAVINPGHEDRKNIKLIKSISDLFNKRTFSGLQGF